jgi:putative hemolysin
MKLILILTFFCAIQLSLQSQAAEKSKSQQQIKSKTNSGPVLKSAKMTPQTLTSTSRCIDDPKNPRLKCSKRTPVKRSQQELIAQKNKPKLKSNEYSLSYENNKTTVFGTKIHEGLLLSQNCFKSKTPQCQAYTKSIQITNSKPEDHMKSPYHNNLGAIHCELMGGKGLIAKTSTNDDSDFCQFEDGSMVSSWSAYYKTHPQTIQTK